jgi:hypothetical protein
MTLGCGAQGNNITSDNISPLHLINLKRIAYGVREVEAAQPEKRNVIERVVDQWLDRKTQAPVASTSAPLTSFKELQPALAKPAAFVCEDDVRAAIDSNSQIVLGKKTIVTPSARDLWRSPRHILSPQTKRICRYPTAVRR